MFKEPPPAMIKAPPPYAPLMFKEPPPEAPAMFTAAPPEVLAMIKAPPQEALAMSKAPPPEAYQNLAEWWPTNLLTMPTVEQIRRCKEHVRYLEPPPKPKPMAKPKPMPEAEPTGRITVVSPGDPDYATDGVPWLQCTICHVFQPFALTYHPSCTTLCGVECTYGESQQQEATLAQQQEPYWHRVSSECECGGGEPCDECLEDWCPLCGRYDRCMCDDEDIVSAKEGRRMHRLEMEAAWRQEMQ